MKDRYIEYLDGRQIAVSDMPTDDLHLCLDWVLNRAPDPTVNECSREEIAERLRIEIIARSLPS
jgi:hypothetical protein